MRGNVRVSHGHSEVDFQLAKMQSRIIYTIELERIINSLPWRRFALSPSASGSVIIRCKHFLDESIPHFPVQHMPTQPLLWYRTARLVGGLKPHALLRAATYAISVYITYCY